jgi:hypothetical protein
MQESVLFKPAPPVKATNSRGGGASVLLSKCPNCFPNLQYMVSTHYNDTIKKNISLGSKLAPLRATCKCCGKSINLNSFYKKREIVIGMVNAAKYIQVGELEEVANLLTWTARIDPNTDRPRCNHPICCEKSYLLHSRECINKHFAHVTRKEVKGDAMAIKRWDKALGGRF